MRPTKLTSNLLEAYRAVLADELAAIAFTEEELVWQANQHLALEEQISYRTFQRYKADILARETGEPSPNGSLASNKPSPSLSQRERDCPAAPLALSPEELELERANTELVRQMHVTLKNALMKQKLALVRGIHEGAPNWRRYSWMLERKFPDFNMKTIVPANTKPAAEAPATPPTLANTLPERLKALQKVPEKMEDKWQQYIPMKPFDSNQHWTLDADVLYTVEEGIAYYESLGMENPYRHLGYQEDEYREGGQYRFYGMGPGRLPLRQYCPPKGTFPNLTPEEKEHLWAKQEENNKQANAA